MKSKRAKACDIRPSTKKKVWERDRQHCIICGNFQAMPNAHFIPRSKGGLGIEQNIVTLCQQCHRDFDQTSKHDEYHAIIKDYLQGIYGGEWNEENLIYKKF